MELLFFPVYTPVNVHLFFWDMSAIVTTFLPKFYVYEPKHH